MKILRTSNLHMGQLFHEYAPTYEHHQFLNWLLGSLIIEHIDILHLSGDVFDLSTPAVSVKMFYSFPNQVVKANSNLQIIITAGNHDFSSRLESPKPLLESSNIIPLKDKDGNTKPFCIAAPFLRMDDYPIVTDGDNPYKESIAAFYKEAYKHVMTEKSWSGYNYRIA